MLFQGSIFLSSYNYRQKAKENELYVLPDLLKSAVSKVKKTEDMLSNQMLSGIPEIDLGIEYAIQF